MHMITEHVSTGAGCAIPSAVAAHGSSANAVVLAKRELGFECWLRSLLCDAHGGPRTCSKGCDERRKRPLREVFRTYEAAHSSAQRSSRFRSRAEVAGSA